jgi:hypothetical protein
LERRPGAGQIILLGLARALGLTKGRTVDSLAHYPDWLVVAGATLAAALALWLLLKLLRLALWLLLFGVLLVGLSTAVWLVFH